METKPVRSVRDKRTSEMDIAEEREIVGQSSAKVHTVLIDDEEYSRVSSISSPENGLEVEGTSGTPQASSHNGKPRPPSPASAQESADDEGAGLNRHWLVCLPMLSEKLKLIWTRSEQTEELDGVGELVEAFNAFPYPSQQEVAALARRCALPLDRVKMWFMAQRVRYGISWASEDIEETRSKVQRLLQGQGEEAHSSEMEPWMMEVQEDMEEEEEEEERAFPHSASSLIARAPRLSAGRNRKSKEQLMALRRSFVRSNWPSEAELHRLQAETQLSCADIRKWFSDSRYQLRNNGRHGKSADDQGNDVLDTPPRPESAESLSVAVPQAHVKDEEDAYQEEEEFSHPSSPSPVGRVRLRKKTPEQLEMLKQAFLRCQRPTSEGYTQLVELTGLPRHDIIQWYGDTRYALKNGGLRWVKGERQQLLDSLLREQTGRGGRGRRRKPRWMMADDSGPQVEHRNGMIRGVRTVEVEVNISD